MREAIEQLNAFYAEHDRAFRIDRLAGGWQLLTHPEISPLLDHVHHEKKRRELSPAQLETLSIVAWRQPVLRAEIDELRGVASQDHLRLLTEHRLVQIVGQAEVPGRPNLYGTSREFCGSLALALWMIYRWSMALSAPKKFRTPRRLLGPQDEEGVTEEVQASEESAESAGGFHTSLTQTKPILLVCISERHPDKRSSVQGMFFFILVLALGAIGMLAGLNLLVFVFALLVAAILSGGLQSGPMMLGFQAAAESIPLLAGGCPSEAPRDGPPAVVVMLWPLNFVAPSFRIRVSGGLWTPGWVISLRGPHTWSTSRGCPQVEVYTWSRLQAESGFPFGLLGKGCGGKWTGKLVVRPITLISRLNFCGPWDRADLVRLPAVKPVTTESLSESVDGGWAIVAVTSPHVPPCDTVSCCRVREGVSIRHGS